LPYVPHITIGSMQDRHRAKSLCDELNGEGIDIHGRVEAVTVVALESNTVLELGTFPLRDSG
jgi:2'-5' RNA ligase